MTAYQQAATATVIEAIADNIYWRLMLVDDLDQAEADLNRLADELTRRLAALRADDTATGLL
jgi:phosphoribosyl-ATP pyrophosphohydrolase